MKILKKMDEKFNKVLINRSFIFLLSISICLIGLFITILLFKTNNGDPLINIVFAKSFTKGFFFYGNEGPKWGSTSPLFVLLTTPFFYISLFTPLWLFKILNLILFIIGAIIIEKIFRRNFITYKDWSFLVFPLIFGNIYLGYLTATLYDSILLMGCISLFLFILFDVFNHLKDQKYPIRKQLILLGVAGGLTLLARPESVIFIFLAFLWLFVQSRKLLTSISQFNFYFIFSIFILIVINALYYLPLMIATRNLLPSSVLARATLLSNSFANTIKVFLSRFWVYKIINLLILCSIFSLLIRKKLTENEQKIQLFLLISVIVYLPLLGYSGEVRYISSIFPSLVILSVLTFIFVIKKLLVAHPLFVLGLLSNIFLIYTTTVFVIYYIIPVYSENVIFEKKAAELLNSVASPNDKCLVYKVQIQYFLNCQTLSMDGIVGGEILAYFKKKSNLIDFLKTYKPKYLIISDAFTYRKEFNNTILNDLYLRDNNVPLSGIVETDGIRFKKLFINEEPKLRGMTSWRSIYEIIFID